jgi:hypothetical protein
LYADFSCLDPKRFPDIRNNKLQSGELDELSRHLLKFDKTATGENLRTELKNLALHWDKLKTTELEHYKILIEGNNTEGNDEMSLENQEEEMFVACEYMYMHIVHAKIAQFAASKFCIDSTC